MSAAAHHLDSTAAGGSRWIDVAPVDAVPLGQGRAFLLAGRTIAVFRQRDGRWFASDNACPHRGGPLAEGVLGAGTVICPLHGWRIRLEDGRCLAENTAVRVYPVTTLDGRIVIQISGATP